MPPGDNYRVHRNIGWRTGPGGWPEWFDASLNQWRPWDRHDTGPFPPAELVPVEHRHAVDASVLSASAIFLLHPHDLVGTYSRPARESNVPCGGTTAYRREELATTLMATAFWQLSEKGALVIETRPRRVFSGFDIVLRSTGPAQHPGIEGALAALVRPEPLPLRSVVAKWFGNWAMNNPYRVVPDAVKIELETWEDWLHTPMCIAAQDPAVLERYQSIYRAWTGFISGYPDIAKALIDSTAGAIRNMEKDID